MFKKDPCNECIKKLEKEVKTKLNKDKSVDREMRTILYEQLDYLLDDLRKEHNNVKTEIVSLINHHKKEKNKLTPKLFDTLHKEYNPYKNNKIRQYESSMLDALNANKSRDPEEEAFDNIFETTQYSPKSLTKQKKKKSNSVRKTKRLSQSAREAGIKRVKDGYLITPKTQYRYSAPEKNTSDDFEPKPPKKKGFFENLFGSPKKGGRRTRKKRKRKRTRKKRKKRRRKTRK